MKTKCITRPCYRLCAFRWHFSGKLRANNYSNFICLPDRSRLPHVKFYTNRYPPVDLFSFRVWEQKHTLQKHVRTRVALFFGSDRVRDSYVTSKFQGKSLKSCTRVRYNRFSTTHYVFRLKTNLACTWKRCRFCS